jgi:Flp pilus assembly secretin CpaC
MLHKPHHERRRFGCVAGITGLALSLALPAAAQQRAAILRVTVDHASALTLAAEPAIVLIADPEIADIIDERDDLLFVLGRKPGATNLLVFDAAGHHLLDREIVVVPENAETVTVTRATDQTDYSCAPRCAFRAQVPTRGTVPTEIGATSGAAAAALAPIAAPPAGRTSALTPDSRNAP